MQIDSRSCLGRTGLGEQGSISFAALEYPLHMVAKKNQPMDLLISGGARTAQIGCLKITSKANDYKIYLQKKAPKRRLFYVVPHMESTRGLSLWAF